MVILLLVVCAFVGACPVAFGPPMYFGVRKQARATRKLEETGVEVDAVLISMGGQARTTTLCLVYEYPNADGSTALHTAYAAPNPLYVVGDSYPLVRTPHLSKDAELGTLAAVRELREDHERSVRHTGWAIVAGAAMLTLAVTGLFLTP